MRWSMEQVGVAGWEACVTWRPDGAGGACVEMRWSCGVVLGPWSSLCGSLGPVHVLLTWWALGTGRPLAPVTLCRHGLCGGSGRRAEARASPGLP